MGRFRGWLRWPIEWWARVDEEDPLAQTAWQRGKLHALRSRNQHPRYAFLVTVIPGAATALVTANSPLARVLLVLLFGAIGYALIPVAWAGAVALNAPRAQREEAREQVHENAARHAAEVAALQAQLDQSRARQRFVSLLLDRKRWWEGMRLQRVKQEHYPGFNPAASAAESLSAIADVFEQHGAPFGVEAEGATFRESIPEEDSSLQDVEAFMEDKLRRLAEVADDVRRQGQS